MKAYDENQYEVDRLADEVSRLTVELAGLQLQYDAELPNREAGNGAEATRIFTAMRGVSARLAVKHRELDDARYWAEKFRPPTVT